MRPVDAPRVAVPVELAETLLKILACTEFEGVAETEATLGRADVRLVVRNFDSPADAPLPEADNGAGGDCPATVVLLINVQNAAVSELAALPTAWVRLAWPCPPSMLLMAMHQSCELRQLSEASRPPSGSGLDSGAGIRSADELLAVALGVAGMFDFEYDLATGVRRASSRDTQVIGHSPANIAETLALVHGEDRQRVADAFDTSRATGCRYSVELRAMLAGGYRWIRSEGAVVNRSSSHPGQLLGVSWDIHDDREARALIKQARRRLDQAFATAGMIGWEWSVASGTRAIVGDGLAITEAGSTSTAILESCIDSEDLPGDLEALEIAIRDATPYQHLVRVRAASGEVRWLHLTGHPRRDARGAVVSVQGVGLDVTERQAMNEELADVRALLMSSLEAARMYCWEWNIREGTRRTIGPSRSLLGCAPDSTALVQQMIHPDDIENDKARMAATIERAQPYQNDFRIIKPDGQVRWISSRGDPIQDADGNVVRLTGVAMDISERREAEIQFADANHRLSIALDAAALNPWSVDLVKEIHSSGPLDEALYGVVVTSAEQFDDLIVPEDRGVAARLRDPVFLLSQEPIHLEYRIRHQDGGIRWIACHAKSVCDASGQPTQLVGVSYDISEARGAQEKLSRSLSQLDRVQSATNVVLWEWDRSLGPRCYQSGGVELSGAELPPIHPGDRWRVARRLLRCARSNEGMDEEFRILVSPESVAWVTVQGRRTEIDPVRGAIVAGVMMDVSGRRQAAERLAVAEERLRRALQAARMTCWDWHVDVPLDGSDDLPDYSPTTAGGAVHPEDQQRHRVAIAEALSGSASEYRCEFRVIGKDGETVWLLSVGRRILDAEGRTLGLTGVAMDVTTQKALEDALQESREWQRMAAAAGELNLWRVNVQTGERRGGELDLDLFGFVPSSLSEVENIISAGDRERVDLAWQDSTATGSPYSIEYQIDLPGQESRWLRVRGQRVRDPHSSNSYMMGATIDISEQRRTEAELQQALDLARQSSEAKSGFLASMSHELRTPLNAVIGFSGLLSTSSYDATQLSHLHALRTSASQLLALVNDVLDFSRIEAGELHLESVALDLEEVLEGALDMASGMADEKGLDLMMVARGDLHRRVVGDPTRIRQVVLNLLSNAGKFTLHGSVRLDLEVRARGDVALVTIMVTDTGIGMSVEVIGHLFQPFRQGDVSTTRRFGGTGLGLSICKRLVDRMGGTIAVTSEPGQGSRFEITIELAFSDDHQSAISLPLERRFGLCISSPALQDALSEQLAHMGSGSQPLTWEAVKRLAEAPSCEFDAVIVDRLMLGLVSQLPVWPRTLQGTLLPIVSLVGIDEATSTWAGPHGEMVSATSRALKPRRLAQVLATTCEGGTSDGLSYPEPLGPVPQGDDEERSVRILVAEDNEINQTLLLLQLESLGVTAWVVDSGHEALEFVSAQPIDIIFMDVEMPGMDGLEATRAIRSQFETWDHAPYIVAVTAHVFGDSRARMKEAGMDDFVSKPVILHELREALDRARAAVGLRSGKRRSVD